MHQLDDTTLFLGLPPLLPCPQVDVQALLAEKEEFQQQINGLQHVVAGLRQTLDNVEGIIQDVDLGSLSSLMLPQGGSAQDFSMARDRNRLQQVLAAIQTVVAGGASVYGAIEAKGTPAVTTQLRMSAFTCRKAASKAGIDSFDGGCHGCDTLQAWAEDLQRQLHAAVAEKTHLLQAAVCDPAGRDTSEDTQQPNEVMVPLSIEAMENHIISLNQELEDVQHLLQTALVDKKRLLTAYDSVIAELEKERHAVSEKASACDELRTQMAHLRMTLPSAPAGQAIAGGLSAGVCARREGVEHQEAEQVGQKGGKIADRTEATSDRLSRKCEDTRWRDNETKMQALIEASATLSAERDALQ